MVDSSESRLGVNVRICIRRSNCDYGLQFVSFLFIRVQFEKDSLNNDLIFENVQGILNKFYRFCS